jgi:hypothetical protein
MVASKPSAAGCCGRVLGMAGSATEPDENCRERRGMKQGKAGLRAPRRPRACPTGPDGALRCVFEGVLRVTR